MSVNRRKIFFFKFHIRSFILKNSVIRYSVTGGKMQNSSVEQEKKIMNSSANCEKNEKFVDQSQKKNTIIITNQSQEKAIKFANW